MPIFRTCATNVEGAALRFEQTQDERQLVLGWLCAEDNRVEINGDRSSFLDDVHDSYHDRGYLSDAQWSGIGRWYARYMRGQQNRDSSIPAGPVSLINIEPAETMLAQNPYRSGHEVRTGATWLQAEWVYNGEYMVRRGTTASFRIHTIANSRNSPELVGKRAVSVYQNDRWIPFAFVSTSGHLTLWSRFADQEDEFFVRSARALLESFRNTDRGAGSTRWITDRYTITREALHCRSCNRDMSLDSLEDRNDGIHDSDCSADRIVATTITVETAPAGRRTRTTAYRPATPANSTTPIIRPPALSENGTGWIQ